MKSLIVLAVKHLAVVLVVIGGAIAAIGVPSLAGFVLGAVLSGASLLILNARAASGRRTGPAKAKPDLAVGGGAGFPYVSLTYHRPAWSHPYLGEAAEPRPSAAKNSYAPRHAARRHAA